MSSSSPSASESGDHELSTETHRPSIVTADNKALLIVFGVLALLAFAPLWWTYFRWTWQDGHYQYFPLLIAMIGVLYKMRLPHAMEEATAPSRSVAIAGFAVIVVAVLAAHLLNSGMIGIIATAAATWLATYALFGSGGLLAMLPVLLLWLLAIPLPLNYDQTLILKMQFFASQLASLLLDGAGIRHVREGVVLITEKSQYMTEEACSGVRSLFSSLAVVAVYSVATEHRFVRIGFNLLQAIFWVLIGNAVRVAACVYLADNVSTWYASGAGHEMLSMVVFAFILGMVASTDKIVGRFVEGSLGMKWTGDESIEMAGELDPAAEMAEGGRSWLGRRRSIEPVEEMGGGDEAETEFADESRTGILGRKPKEKEYDESMGDDDFDRPVGIFSRLSTRSAIIVGVILFPIIVLGWFAAIRTPANTALSIAQMPRLPAAEQGFLPAELAGWKQVAYQKIERPENGLMAPLSYAWTFKRGDVGAVVSVDCPWNEWHNLNVCYAAIGWDTEPEYFLDSPPEVGWSQLGYSKIVMSKRNGRHGYVLFTVVDRHANEMDAMLGWRSSLANPQELISNSVTSALNRLGFGEIQQSILPGTTIQMYGDRSGEFSPAEIAQFNELFFAAREKLLESPRWQGVNEVKN